MEGIKDDLGNFGGHPLDYWFIHSAGGWGAVKAMCRGMERMERGKARSLLYCRGARELGMTTVALAEKVNGSLLFHVGHSGILSSGCSKNSASSVRNAGQVGAFKLLK